MPKQYPPATQAAIDAGESDAEMIEFMSALEDAVQQAQRGEFAAIHTPEAIIERRARGRPKGSKSANRKEAITLRLPPDVLDRWRSTGPGWQTRMVQRLSAP